MTDNITGIIPGMMGAALVADNMSMFGHGRKKKKRSLVNQGMRNMVGIGLIGATAGMIPK